MKGTVSLALGPGPARNRQVPRVPSPASGVTSGGRMSSIPSADLTRPSSLRRTHPPVPTPRAALVGKPGTARLCRLPSAPAGRGTFPTLSLQSWSSRLDPYPAVFLRCMARCFPKDSGLAIGTTSLAHRTIPATQLQQGGIFRGCSHSLMFRLLNSLGPQIAPTARPLSVLGGRAVYTRPNSGPLPARSTGIATCLKRATGTAGLAPAGLQPCRLLLSPYPLFGLLSPYPQQRHWHRDMASSNAAPISSGDASAGRRIC
jgi:hypothetical protein